ncbi:hypothetical protein [Streptomyces sp. RerS4]|uniref:hypothetical protein n=1 Tax=Streptomyces sp. RerS4 TaxID=2942449 RepID=UPI00201BB60A|nr:hypothetical protein [Streptomyces sp. RerS4]UQX04358.1 hypothetical protein M4D82_30525 [Streptomyces sp. RerS4]
MNDPSTFTATEHDDREGPPTGPDPNPRHLADPDLPNLPDLPAVSVLPDPPDEEEREPEPTPAPGVDTDQSATPIRTLLETAATCRPVEEVTALVGLLKQSGQHPDTGHDALRAAAVARPLDEVRHMVTLLGEAAHDEVGADVALRAAAVGRPIEDVVQLAGILAPGAEPSDAPATGPSAGPPTDRRAAGPQSSGPRPASPDPSPPPRTTPEPPAPPPPAPGRTEPPPAPRSDATPVGLQAALRHVLRWPTAAALLLCGVLHLPANPAEPPEPVPADLLPLAASLLCLGLGALLAVRDTPLVWRASAVTALAVVTLHIVGGIVFFDPLDGSLGGPHGWAGVTVVLGAGAAAVLAGAALKYRAPRPRTGGET